MEKIYFAFVDTPGFFSLLIHHFLKQKYIHVVISLDENLEEAYSVGRRNPRVPFLAGFEKEEKEKIIKAFPTADYCIYEFECTAEQKVLIEKSLHKDYKRRFQIHYAIIGLPFILWNKPFYHKNFFTCSSYIAKLLSDNGVELFDKHFSLVTPKDFFEYKNKRKIFEGSLAEFLNQKEYSKRRIAEEIL